MLKLSKLIFTVFEMEVQVFGIFENFIVITVLLVKFEVHEIMYFLKFLIEILLVLFWEKWEILHDFFWFLLGVEKKSLEFEKGQEIYIEFKVLQ